MTFKIAQRAPESEKDLRLLISSLLALKQLASSALDQRSQFKRGPWHPCKRNSGLAWKNFCFYLIIIMWSTHYRTSLDNGYAVYHHPLSQEVCNIQLRKG